jgi:hypothetical protein
MMMTIAWNPFELYLVESIPRGRAFNAEYYCDNILIALIPLCPEDERR